MLCIPQLDFYECGKNRNWSFDAGQGEDEMYDSLDGFEKAVDKRRERWLAEGAGA